MYQSPKSATTAGLLGIFLGAFGAHNWYLGEKGKGIAHVCMMSGGVLLEIIVGAVLPNVLSFSMLINLAWLLAILAPIALAAMSASGIWGLVEGIIILSQGDAGLARKGYNVAPQPNYYGPNYNQPMDNGYGMGNGMNNMGNMNQMNNMNNMPNNMNGDMNNMGQMSNNMGNMPNDNINNDMNSQNNNFNQNNNGNDNGQQ